MTIFILSTMIFTLSTTILAVMDQTVLIVSGGVMSHLTIVVQDDASRHDQIESALRVRSIRDV
jgi:hypothetical protein